MSSLVSKSCIELRSTVDKFHMVMKFCNKEHVWVGKICGYLQDECFIVCWRPVVAL